MEIKAEDSGAKGFVKGSVVHFFSRCDLKSFLGTFLKILWSEVFDSIEVRFLMALVQWCSCFLFSDTQCPRSTTLILTSL